MFSALVIKTASQVVNYLQDLLCKFKPILQLKTSFSFKKKKNMYKTPKNNEVNNKIYNDRCLVVHMDFGDWSRYIYKDSLDEYMIMAW